MIIEWTYGGDDHSKRYYIGLGFHVNNLPISAPVPIATINFFAAPRRSSVIAGSRRSSFISDPRRSSFYASPRFSNFNARRDKKR